MSSAIAARRILLACAALSSLAVMGNVGEVCSLGAQELTGSRGSKCPSRLAAIISMSLFAWLLAVAALVLDVLSILPPPVRAGLSAAAWLFAMIASAVSLSPRTVGEGSLFSLISWLSVLSLTAATYLLAMGDDDGPAPSTKAHATAAPAAPDTNSTTYTAPSIPSPAPGPAPAPIPGAVPPV